MKNFLNRNFYLILIFLGALTWFVSIPIFMAPDEQAHFYHIQYIAERKSLPDETHLLPKVMTSEYVEKTLEVINFSQIIHNSSNHFEFSSDKYGKSEFLLRNNVWQAKTKKNFTYYGLDYNDLYYLLNAPIYLYFKNDILAQTYAIRFFSILLFLITGYICQRCFKKYFRLDNARSSLMTIILCFFPMFMFIETSINNDVLMNLLFALFFFLLISYWNKVLDKNFFIYLLLILSAGYLTKSNFVFLIIYFPIFLFLKALKEKSLELKSFTKKIWILICSFFLLSFLLFSYIFNLYLGNLSLFMQKIDGLGILNILKLAFIERYSLIFKSFFAKFGWMDTLIYEPFYFIFLGISIFFVAIALLYLYKVKFRDYFFIFLILSILILDFSYALIFLIGVIKENNYAVANQGRYYFTVLIPIFLMFFKALFTFFKLDQKKILILGSLIMIFINFISLILYV